MPRKIGPYILQDLLGTGGMGAVYKALQENLDRPVALKILKPGTTLDSDSVVRFHREMKLMAGLRHANVVEIVDGGEVDGYPFIAMELVPGESLDKLIEKVGALPSGLVLAMTSRILEGLSYLHERQILHRDLKPANIRVSDEGLVKLLDFGLAKMSNATVMTVEGTVLGTVQYIAPEVLLGEPASARSDIWAVGCILYVLLTGKLHVHADTLEQWIDQVSAKPIQPPVQVKPDLPQEVSDLVLLLLQQDPDARPRSAKRVMKQVDDLLFALTEKTWENYLYPGFLKDLKTSAGYESATIPVVAPASVPGRASSNSLKLPSQRRSGQVSGRFSKPVVLPPPATGRRWPLARLLLAILVPVIFWKIAGSRTPAIAPGASATGGSPTASPSAAPAKSLSLTARYLPYEKYLPDLAEDGAKAKEIVSLLQKELAPFDLGEPRIWAHWIRLNRWLATKPGPGDRPPRARDGIVGEVPYLETKIIFGYLERIDSGYNNYLVASAYRGVTQYPDDARPWLMLGRALELEGRVEDAKVTYRLALELLDKLPVEFRNCPATVWEGLLRAWLHRGDKLEENWWVLDGKLLSRHEAWAGLVSALSESDPELYRRVLRRALEEGREHDGIWALAMTYLARHELDQGRWRESVELLERAVAQSRDGPIVNLLISYHLQRGQIAQAREYDRMNSMHGKDWMSLILPYLTRPLGPGTAFDRPLYTQLIRPTVLELEIAREIESGEFEGARRDLIAATSGKDLRAVLDPARFAADLLGASGTADPAMEKILEGGLLGETFRLDLWARAAGALATDAGAPWMEKRLEAAAARWKDSPEISVVRALWLSRRGKDRDALHILVPVLKDPTRKLPEDLVLEVVTRPYWQTLFSGDPEIIDRIRELPDFKLSSHRRPYWEAVKEGDLPKAYGLARDLFMANPHQPIWALAILWYATGGETPEQAKEWRNTLRSAFRYNLAGAWLMRELRVLDLKVGK